MDYEKLYKEALKRAEAVIKVAQNQKEVYGCAITIFPELKESEDEMIRKELIEFVKSRGGFKQEYIVWLEKQGEQKPTKKQVWDYCNKISSEWWQITMNKWKTLTDEEKSKYNQYIGFNDFSDVLMNITAGALFQLIDTGKLEYEEGSLLLEKPDDTPKPLEVVNAINEKQGEQKPADKVETKQKPDIEKDKWYVCNTARYTDFVVGKAYYCPKNGMLKPDENEMARYVARNCFHPWTIQDAKDGDVLTWDDSKCIALFKEIYNKHSFKSHGCIGACTDVFENWGFHDIENAHPSTKEQRELLFQKMKEAGYEWDEKKKNLRKIEQEDSGKVLDDWCKCTTNGVVTEEDRIIQNIMRMRFPLSDQRGVGARFRRIKREHQGMVWYETVLVPVYDINEPTV